MRQKYQEHIQNLKEQVLKEIKELIPIGTFVHFSRRFQYIPSNRWAKYRDVARLCSVYHSPTNELMFLTVYDYKAKEFKLSLTTNKGWGKFIKQTEKGVLESCGNTRLFDFWEKINEEEEKGRTDFSYLDSLHLDCWDSDDCNQGALYEIPLEVLIYIRNWLAYDWGGWTSVDGTYHPEVNRQKNRIIINN
jgi:hypothetical protein